MRNNILKQPTLREFNESKFNDLFSGELLIRIGDNEPKRIDPFNEQDIAYLDAVRDYEIDDISPVISGTEHIEDYTLSIHETRKYLGIMFTLIEPKGEQHHGE